MLSADEFAVLRLIRRRHNRMAYLRRITGDEERSLQRRVKTLLDKELITVLYIDQQVRVFGVTPAGKEMLSVPIGV